MANPTKSQSAPKFRVGDKVRVRKGIPDPDFPDLPLGGWVGTVNQVEFRKGPAFYCIVWSPETLAAVHPVFRKRCERDGLDDEHGYLAEDDLEPYDGEPLAIEQPTRIITKPLSPDDQDDRVRLILGATGDDPVPGVDEDTLRAYRRYLSGNLAVPFEAKHSPEDGPGNPVTVTGLADRGKYDGDEFHGLFCEAGRGRRRIIIPLAEIEVRKGAPNYRLIDDYLYWFWNYR